MSAPGKFAATVGAAGLCLALAPTAAADPIRSDDPGQASPCNYTLSDPQIVQVSGVTMVGAYLTPAGCSGSAQPSSSQVCLSAPNLASRCGELPGYDKAWVYLSPYVPGSAYTVTGRGCASQIQPPGTVCSTLGPRTVTL